MKRTFLSLLPFTIAITLGLTSCSDSDTPEEPNPDGPYGGIAVDYNINDYKITLGQDVYEPITAENWRSQGSMFLYVGSNGADASIQDTNGRTGYRLVNLPWAKGTVESNLPKSFTLSLAIFKGTPKVPIVVEFDHYLADGECFLQLVSPGANEAVEAYRDSCIDEVLGKIREIAPEIAIMEK